MAKGKHITIVGGGASGVLLACHLLRNDEDDIHVTLIEKRPAVGRGMAYSTAQPGHLLNVRATNMSAFADDPLHFCRWLAENDDDAHGEQPGPLTFAQRRVYGRYIAQLITPHLGPPGKPGRLQVIYGEGRAITVTPAGVRIGVDDGRCFASDMAVLATGHDEAVRGAPACYVNPWESPADAGVDRDAAVLIRGTGLTMVDFVVSLKADG
ncbi:MAG: FAD/NAD(P)-binding protein, partial [Methyloceanibacter sp.]